MGSSSSKESNSRGKNIQLKLPSEYSSLAFFYRKKAVVTKEKIEMKPSNEDAAAGRVSNLQVHKCQQVRRRIVYFFEQRVVQPTYPNFLVAALSRDSNS